MHVLVDGTAELAVVVVSSGFVVVVSEALVVVVLSGFVVVVSLGGGVRSLRSVSCRVGKVTFEKVIELQLQVTLPK